MMAEEFKSHPKLADMLSGALEAWRKACWEPDEMPEMDGMDGMDGIDSGQMDLWEGMVCWGRRLIGVMRRGIR